MYKAIRLIISALVLIYVTPAMGEILFYDDCEDAYKISDWTREGGSVAVSAGYARAGSKSYKFTQKTSDERAELVLAYQGLGNLSYNTDYWFGYSFYVESGWSVPMASGWCAIGQWHFYPDSCDGGWNRNGGQPLSFFVNGNSAPYLTGMITADTIKCNTSQVWFTDGPFNSDRIVKGGWNDVVVHVRFNYAGAGINEAWLNGKKFMSQSSISNAYYDTHAPYFKIGVYAGTGNNTSIYVDEIRVGGPNSSYSEVAPKGSGSNASQPDETDSNVATLSPPTLKLAPATE